MPFDPTYDPAHYLDRDDEEEPASEDGCDISFFTGWTLGRMWQRLKTDSIVKAVVHAKGAEMVIRMGEMKGIPFTCEYLSDTFMMVTLGSVEERDPKVISP